MNRCLLFFNPRGNMTTENTTTTLTTATEGAMLPLLPRHRGGAEFDNSHTRGEPITFTLGSGQMIPGFKCGRWNDCGRNKTVTSTDQAYGDKSGS